MAKVEHVFEWKFGGTEVLLMGEFNTWMGEVMNKVEPPDLLKPAGYTQQPLGQRVSGGQQPSHCLIKLLDPGRYEYKFRVDGQWRYAPDQQVTRDNRGNENNVVDITGA